VKVVVDREEKHDLVVAVGFDLVVEEGRRSAPMYPMRSKR
jgi:hypothetical protein